MAGWGNVGVMPTRQYSYRVLRTPEGALGSNQSIKTTSNNDTTDNALRTGDAISTCTSYIPRLALAATASAILDAPVRPDSLARCSRNGPKGGFTRAKLVNAASQRPSSTARKSLVRGEEDGQSDSPILKVVIIEHRLRRSTSCEGIGCPATQVASKSRTEQRSKVGEQKAKGALPVPVLEGELLPSYYCKSEGDGRDVDVLIGPRAADTKTGNSS
ncbi:uncharacterized protein BP5553_01261 [Venustampulla echinocandica]|uniref:Uncharacterized protein n=1 Tax=Venustampulla echinocandica TaxID=2656787 RepID=A0A370U0H4_9HELO|nr:uncharacterized protein BP5553_01261 [Venustampulla echinocandica]RDL41282.1 hypothetical protein BP5553_01261 [Venustampulla echinocandica]